MNKTKVVKTGIKVGALALGGFLTWLNGKISSNEMRETVVEEVKKAMAEQAKES